MSESDDLLGVPAGTLARLSAHGDALDRLRDAFRRAVDTDGWPGGLAVRTVTVSLRDGAADTVTIRLHGGVRATVLIMVTGESGGQVLVRDENTGADGDAFADLMGSILGMEPSARQRRTQLLEQVEAHATGVALPALQAALARAERDGLADAVSCQASFQLADRALSTARRKLREAAGHVLDAELAHRRAAGDPDATLAVLAADWGAGLGALLDAAEQLQG